jgi:hypothetical protein
MNGNLFAAQILSNSGAGWNLPAKYIHAQFFSSSFCCNEISLPHQKWRDGNFVGEENRKQVHSESAAKVFRRRLAQIGGRSPSFSSILGFLVTLLSFFLVCGKYSPLDEPSVIALSSTDFVVDNGDFRVDWEEEKQNIILDTEMSQIYKNCFAHRSTKKTLR